MDKPRVIFGSVFLFIALAAAVSMWVIYAELSKPRSFYDTGITDEEYVSIASQTAEATRFLEKYPNASASVDRSGALAVDYWEKKEIDVNTTYYIRLRVFINPETNTPGDRFINCRNRSGSFYIRDDLLKYLETEDCLRY